MDRQDVGNGDVVSPDRPLPTDVIVDAVSDADLSSDTPLDAAADAHSAATDTSRESDASAATAAETAGEVSPAPMCSDDNSCTSDQFDGVGCTHTAVADGTPCDDGNTCTLGDSCKGGVCVSGSASQQGLTELGRIDSFGHEHGLVVSTGDGHLLFADQADGQAVLHTARFEQDSLITESAVHPGAKYDPVAADYASAAYAGWPGHVALAWVNDETVRVITIDQTGKPTLHPSFRGPRWAGFLVGEVHGMAGNNTDLWICMSYSFFGPAMGSLYHYDLSDPDKPVLTQTVDSPNDCGSVAISSDGKRVYFNSLKGIYWFDPTMVVSADAGTEADASEGTDAGGSGDAGHPVLINGPFGVNSGLTMYGSTLLARSNEAVVLYDADDQKEMVRVRQPGLVGAGYLPEQHLLVLMRQEQQGDGTSQRWLFLRDAASSEGGPATDEILIERGALPSTRIPTSGDVVFDPRLKAAFRVVAGKLRPLNLPMLGGFGALTGKNRTLQAWSPTAWHALDVSTLSQPTWIPPGGPVLGRTRSVGIDVGMTTLIDDPGFPDSYEPPRPGRVVADSNYLHSQRSLVLALRDGAQWNQATEAGRVLLAGDQTQTLAWSAESLYGIDNSSINQIHLRRWDRAQLSPSSTPVQPREDLVLPPLGLSTSAIVRPPSLDFPATGEDGLVVIPYWLRTDGGLSYNTVLYWIRRTPLQVVATASLTDAAVDCRTSGVRAVCVSSSFLHFVERGPDPQSPVIRQEKLADSSGILAFDGTTVYLSESNGLRAVAFNSTAEQIKAAPTIRFSHFPLTMTAGPGYWAVASAHELVMLLPQCAAR